jgi:hypothetical protein
VVLLLPRGGQLRIRSGRVGGNNPIESESEGDGEFLRVLGCCGERGELRERKRSGREGFFERRKLSLWRREKERVDGFGGEMKEAKDGTVPGEKENELGWIRFGFSVTKFV